MPSGPVAIPAGTLLSALSRSPVVVVSLVFSSRAALLFVLCPISFGSSSANAASIVRLINSLVSSPFTPIPSSVVNEQWNPPIFLPCSLMCSRNLLLHSYHPDLPPKSTALQLYQSRPGLEQMPLLFFTEMYLISMPPRWVCPPFAHLCSLEGSCRPAMAALTSLSHQLLGACS
uniref:Putative secreted protein n=1 Tax=Ixodes ricinus TaxID=34613 RepID=A0A6B0UYL9_IXORI